MQSPWVVNQPFEILTARDPSAKNDQRIYFEVGSIDIETGARTKIADANGIGYKSWDGSTLYAYITDGMHWAVYTLPKTVIMHELIKVVPKLDIICAKTDARYLISFTESELDGSIVFAREKFVDVNPSVEGSQRYQELGPVDTFSYWAPGAKAYYCKIINRREPLILRVRHYEDDAGQFMDTFILKAQSWSIGEGGQQKTAGPKSNTIGTYTLDKITLLWKIQTGPKPEDVKYYTYVPIVTMDGERMLMRVLPSLSFELRTWAPPGSDSFLRRITDHVACMGPMGNVLELRVITVETSLSSVNLYNMTEDLFDANNG